MLNIFWMMIGVVIMHFGMYAELKSQPQPINHNSIKEREMKTHFYRATILINEIDVDVKFSLGSGECIETLYFIAFDKSKNKTEIDMTLMLNDDDFYQMVLDELESFAETKNEIDELERD